MDLLVACAALTGVAVGGGLALAAAGGGEPLKLAGGFKFTEGPVWYPDGRLLFSDIPADTIFALKGGAPELFRRPSGNSNGLTLDLEGRLIACEHGNRRVSRTEKDGTVVDLATHYEGKRLNSPNDVVVSSGGAVYFTDPPYGVKEEERELDFQGVYRIAPDGGLKLLVDDFVKPNGLAFSPDEDLLYVADTELDHVRVFSVLEDGTLGEGRVFAGVEPPMQLRPDGMKVDVGGNLYVAGFDGVWIFDTGGRHTATVELPERPANLAFGGPEGRTLYVTARDSIYSFEVETPGAAIPAQRIPGGG